MFAQKKNQKKKEGLQQNVLLYADDFVIYQQRSLHYKGLED